MTPKRFKAVCTETGREFGTDDLVCGGYVRDDLYKPIGLYWSVEFQDKNQAAIDSILCQSTGLTDAKEQEVYEGDVLFMIVDDDLMLFCVERSSSNTCIELCPMDGDYRFVEPIDNYVEDNSIDHVVIGNRWMPQAELQARAEAVTASTLT